MEAMEMLWSYMKEDMKADRVNNELRSSPLRQKLEKTRDYILEQQKSYKLIEEQVAIHADRKDAIQDALTRAKDQLDNLLNTFETNPPKDEESAAELLAEAEHCRRNLSSYEQELRRIQKDATDFSQRSATIRNSTVRARREFDQMKETYTAESEQRKQEYAALRKAADAKAVGIPEDLMAVYNSVKRQITPPMARLVNGQCSGCNTSQPSAALRKIDAGKEIVECETCGRILIK
ncbi:MAG: hypothetical protein IKS31_10185 [Clostridia bacterium]|nr:hypothetical protein [Clostridia bacterium]